MIKRTFTIAIVGWFGVALAFAQNTQYTKNSADETLRSTGRVNPASLAMEMDVPVGQYPGRGINLPLGLSYSSKVWLFQEYGTYQLNNDSQRIYAEAKFGEDSAAGWTSSLSQPYIEYVGEQNRFDQEGKPLPGEMDMPGGPAPYGNIFVKRIMVFLPGGASHELRAAEEPIWLTGGMAPDESVWNTTFYAVDGSGLKYVQDSTATPAKYELWLPDGSRYDFNPTREDKGSTDVTQIRRGSRLTDVNGNYVQFNAAATGYPNGSWTDQLGRTFPVMIPRETPTLAPTAGVLEQSFTLPGMSEPYVLRWKRLKGATAADSAFTDFGTQVLKYPGHTNMDYQNPTSYSPSLFTGGPNPDYRMNQCSFNYLYIGNQGFPAQLFNPVVLAEIVLPNGAEYEFTYNEFGEIEQVRYPAGGSEMITYAPVPSLADLAKPYQQSNRGVTERRIYENDADSSPDTWTYSAESSTNNYRTSTIAPDGTRTDRFMHRAAPPPTICPSEYTVNYYRGTRYGYDNALNGMAYEERRFSSAGQLVNRTFTRWGVTKTTVGFVAEPGNPSRINWGTQAQRNARTLSTESITYDGDTGLSAVGTVEYETGEDALGSPLNVTKTTQYAFKVVSGGGSVAPGEAPPVNAVTLTDPSSGATPVRMTTVTYMSSDPAYSQTVKDGYAANNIRKLATATQTKNGTGSVTAAQTEIRYDEPTYGNAYRGQPTTARSWLDTTSSWIETRTKYDAYGNATESTDANGNTSTTVYDPTYNAFPVQVTSPIPSDGTHGSGTAFVTTMTYNPVTGQVLTATDPNGLKTKIEYVDPMLRPTRVAAYDSFDQQVGAATETSYGAGTDSSSRWVKTRSRRDCHP